MWIDTYKTAEENLLNLLASNFPAFKEIGVDEVTFTDLREITDANAAELLSEVSYIEIPNTTIPNVHEDVKLNTIVTVKVKNAVFNASGNYTDEFKFVYHRPTLRYVLNYWLMAALCTGYKIGSPKRVIDEFDVNAPPLPVQYIKPTAYTQQEASEQQANGFTYSWVTYFDNITKPLLLSTTNTSLSIRYNALFSQITGLEDNTLDIWDFKPLYVGSELIREIEDDLVVDGYYAHFEAYPKPNSLLYVDRIDSTDNRDYSFTMDINVVNDLPDSVIVYPE